MTRMRSSAISVRSGLAMKFPLVDAILRGTVTVIELAWTPCQVEMDFGRGPNVV